MLRLARERDRLSIVDDQIGAPTTSIELARATHAIVTGILAGRFGAPEDWSGLYHMTCAGSVSWFGFAQAIFARAAAVLGVKAAEAHSESHQGLSHSRRAPAQLRSLQRQKLASPSFRHSALETPSMALRTLDERACAFFSAIFRRLTNRAIRIQQHPRRAKRCRAPLRHIALQRSMRLRTAGCASNRCRSACSIISCIHRRCCSRRALREPAVASRQRRISQARTPTIRGSRRRSAPSR